VVEGVSARLGRSLALPDSEPHSLVYAPGLDRLYVCDIRQKRVLVVDPGSLAVTGEFGVEGAKPSMVRLSPDEKILYVLSNAGCCLYAVDSRTHRIVGACTDLNPQPRKLTVGHEGKIYIAHAGEDGGLYVISPERRWITFCSDREGNYQIFRMALDGTNLTRLTHNRATELCPRWSPDGTRIAFVTDRAGPPHVAVMNEDGSDCRVLHETNPLSGRPDEVNSQLDWSPDGTRIVFCYSWDRVGVGIVELENGAVHDLLSLPAPGGQDWVSGVCWTQDGILASWHNSRADGGAQVIRISPQDGHTEVLLPKEPHCYPSQCPVTGRLLVFGQIPLDRPAPDLHIVAPGTDEAIPLLVRDVRDTAPCWTPDGKGVVFCSGTASARRAIWAMDSDGRNPRQLTTVESDNCQPDVKLWQ
jgi:WD40 repeat protein